MSDEPLLTRRRLIGATIETTKGTAATVSAALDGIFSDIRCEPVDLYSEGERRPAGLYQGTVDAIKGQQVGRLSFRQEWRSGDCFGTLAQACGFTKAASVYTPTSDVTAQKCLTFKVWESGRVKSLTGCAGNFTIEPGGPGQRVFINWEWQGVWVAPVDEAMPNEAPIVGAPYRSAGVTLTVGGSALPKVSTWQIQMNNTVEMRDDITKAAAVANFLVSERGPQMTVDPEARLVADHDAFGLLLAGTTGALSLALSDGSNTVTLAGARVQRLQVGDSDRNQKLTDALTLALHNSSGNDDLVITEA